MENPQLHWENIYQNKQPHQVSWTQERPEPSLSLIENLALTKDAAIIDIDGGDSLLVDFLLKAGYTNITVLDISAQAIERAKNRLGDAAKQVNWVVSNVLDFKPAQKFAFWHDRAAFHFLTNAEEIEQYKALLDSHVSDAVVLATFSKQGPEKCSGLPITQYDVPDLAAFLPDKFSLCEGLEYAHTTPFGTTQWFTYVSGKK